MAATIFIPGVHNPILVKMLLNKASADVFFQVGNGSTQIPAHRTVLSEASEGFKVRLEGNWAGMTEIAEMTGVEENVFRSLLIFIYKGGEIDFEARYLSDVLMLARSFRMQDMVDKIISKEVFDVYAPHHVWSFLSFAVIAGDEELQNRCLTLIDSDAQRFLSLPTFLSVESSVLKLLVGRNTLGIHEVDFLKILVSWSESSCERRRWQCPTEHQRSPAQTTQKDEADRKLEELTKKINDLAVESEALKVLATKGPNQKNFIQQLTNKINNLAVENEALKALVMKGQDQNSNEPVTQAQSEPSDSRYILTFLSASLYTLIFVYVRYENEVPISTSEILSVFITTAILSAIPFWLLFCYRYLRK